MKLFFANIGFLFFTLISTISFANDSSSDAFENRQVEGINIVFYNIFDTLNLKISHAALRIDIKDDLNPFWQIELIPGKSLPSAENYSRYGYKVTSMFSVPELTDIYVFNNYDARKQMSEANKQLELPQKISVCVNDLTLPKASTKDYRECLDYAAKQLASEKYHYNPMTHNCGHYLEKILHFCNLSNCTNFPRSNGTNHEKGLFSATTK